MFDYFVAFGVAFAGLLVVYYMFQVINKSEIVVMESTKERKSRSRKTAKPQRREGEIELGREIEALIAREVVRGTVGLRSDTALAQPPTLESLCKNSNTKSKASSARAVPVEVTEREILIDKEHGFQRVTETKPKPRKRSSSQGVAQMSPDEEMDRKLGQFFRGNRRDKKSPKFSLKEDQAVSGNGVQVLVKKDISNARTW